MSDKFGTLIQGVFRKTATVQARRWNPEEPFHVTDWLTAGGTRYLVFADGRLGIGTFESGANLDSHAAKPGDWVLQGAAGEFWACDSDIFQRTYEVA